MNVRTASLVRLSMRCLRHGALRLTAFWPMRGRHGLQWLALSAALGLTIHAAAAPLVRFAVLGGVPDQSAQVPAVRDLLAAIANGPAASFILDDGNFKGQQEPCSDTLLQERQALLNSSALPLILVPGAADWVDCQLPAAGSYDPLERLDFLRDLAFATSDSMGVSSIPLEHESDFMRFRNFHENTAWQQSGVLFVTLDVVGHNNHYLDAGGRNGEFEDRTIANRYWLEHALREARQHHLGAVVIAIQGDPGLGASTRRGPFDWLDFRLTVKRDGYLEFKQDLLKFSQQYEGTILLINQTHASANGATAASASNATPPVETFRLSQPWRHKIGTAASRLWQLELNTEGDTAHWVEVELSSGREIGVHASLFKVPADLPTAPLDSSASSAAATPPDLPPVALPVPVISIPGTSDSSGPAAGASGN